MNYHSPLSEGFLAILQAATRLAEQTVVPNFVNLALHEETLKVAISLANQTNNNLAVLQTVQKKNAALQRFLIKLGWPPPWHLPAVLLDRIVEAHESGNFSVEEVSQLFIELYGQKRLKELLEKWKQSEHIGRRATILDEGIQGHIDGRFFSSVCVFSTQIEGVIGEKKNNRDILHCVGGVACPGAEFAGGTGCPSRLCQEGKRKLTESAKEFLKDSTWHSPKGPFREALERRGMPPRHLIWSALSRGPSSSPLIANVHPRVRVLRARRAPGRSLHILCPTSWWQ